YVVSGACMDANDRPLEGVRVRLVRVIGKTETQEFIAEIATKADGRFRFSELAPPVPRETEGRRSGATVFSTCYVVVAQLAGRAPQVAVISSSDDAAENKELRMGIAGTLSGRVTDENGTPIAGAQVGIDTFPPGSPINVFNDVTDSDGQYEINDLNLWD